MVLTPRSLGGIALSLAVLTGLSAQAFGQATSSPSISVTAASAERKDVPVVIDAVGTVKPIDSVAVKPRIDTSIVSVHFKDGQFVNKGDLLFSMDSREIDAKIVQAKAAMEKTKVSLVQAERDATRQQSLEARGSTTQVALETAVSNLAILAATLKADEATIEGLEAQKSYTEIRSPISGRVGAASVKSGNFVRSADATPLVTINRISPIYVDFSIPQNSLLALRSAMKTKSASVAAGVDDVDPETGSVAMIDNSVDTMTGMISVRAIMDNKTERLWPGAIVPTKLTVRHETAVVVPSEAVQRSQSGDFVFVIKDGKVFVRPIKVARSYSGHSVVASGLEGGEQIVTDGQLLLSEGTSVTVRNPKSGS